MSILMLQPASATFRPRRSAAEAVAPAFARRVDVLLTLADIEAIADEWRALEAATPEATGFQSYDWCRAWVRADRWTRNRDDGRWRIVTVRDHGRLVALWPLEWDRLLGARVLRWLGEPWTQYGDALVADGRSRLDYLASAWREIATWTDVDLMKLGRVRADAALTTLPGFAGRTIIHREHAPFIALSGRPLPAPEKRLRARRRKLEAIGPVAFDIVTDPDERRASVKRAIALKEAWLTTRGLTSSGLFHANLNAHMAALADSGTLVIGRLRVGGKVAALELGLRANRTFRSLLGSHAREFAHGSPGHLLIGHMVEWARREDMSAYDLMVPADAYKRQWSNDEIVVHDHLVAMRWRGRLAAGWYRLRPRLKAAYLTLPERLRRLVARGLRGRS